MNSYSTYGDDGERLLSQYDEPRKTKRYNIRGHGLDKITTKYGS